MLFRSEEAMRFLAAARTCSPFGVGELPASPVMLRELEQVHRAQIALHLEKELRSARVLRAIRRTS